MSSQRMLYVIVCAAGPAPQVGKLVSQAQQRGWLVRIISTPAALSFIDVPTLEGQTKMPIRSQPRAPGTPRLSAKADALIIAPATFNTVNKLAAGISDNYALDIINEMISHVPVVMLPFVNSSLASRPQFVRSMQSLKDEGIFSTWEYAPHPPGKGGEVIDTFPWDKALDQVERLYVLEGSRRPSLTICPEPLNDETTNLVLLRMCHGHRNPSLYSVLSLQFRFSLYII
jgi:hypothetical protein